MKRTTECILVAEDETDLRNELVDFLKMEGFAVLCAANGKEAFLMAREHLPDLVISDLRMPDWDGTRLLLEMQADPQLRNTPIIFLTAMVERNNVRDGMALGAADYITKPFTLKELFATIHAQLDKRARMEREIRETSEQAGTDTARRIGLGLQEQVNTIQAEARKMLSLQPHSNSSELREHAGIIISEAEKLERKLATLSLS
jgi:two-component system, sensor histidine kinase and response regulator